MDGLGILVEHVAEPVGVLQLVVEGLREVEPGSKSEGPITTVIYAILTTATINNHYGIESVSSNNYCFDWNDHY